MKNDPKAIGFNVYVLGVVSMLNDVASEMIFAVLPVFLTSVLGLDKSLIGLIEGAAEAASNVAKLVSGRIADSIGRYKRVVAAGYCLSVLSKPFFSFISSAPGYFVLRTADRVGKGIRTSPRDALIADSVNSKTRGKAFGIHRAMDTAGAVIGPVLAIVLLPLMAYDYRDFFMLSIIPGALCLLVLFFFVKEPARKVSKSISRQLVFDWNFLRLRGLGPRFRRALLIASVFALGNFSFVFLMMRLADFGFASAMIPVAYLAFNVVYMSASAPIGSLSDRLGRRRLLMAGYGVFAVLCAIAALGGDMALGWLVIGLYGVFMAAVETLQRAFVVDLVGGKRRATALGAYFGVVGFLAFPASAIAGFLWDAFGAPVPFVFGAAVACAASGMLWLWFPRAGGVRPVRA